MRNILMVAVLALFGATLCAQGQPALSSDDSSKTDCHDRPVGGVKLKLPPPATSIVNPPPPPPPPPPPVEDLPPTEVPPVPIEDGSTFFDEPVQGKVAFLLDASGSMYGSRIASVRQEAVAAITSMNELDEFDCNAYGSQHPAPHYTVFLWGGLMPATDANKSAAIAWINGPATNPGGGTPTYSCLKRSCEVYPASLDKMFLLTDGSPNHTGTSTQILADFPGWWARFDHATLVCVCIGGVGSAQTFMQQLAAIAGGTYIQR